MAPSSKRLLVCSEEIAIRPDSAVLILDIRRAIEKGLATKARRLIGREPTEQEIVGVHVKGDRLVMHRVELWLEDSPELRQLLMASGIAEVKVKIDQMETTEKLRS